MSAVTQQLAAEVAHCARDPYKFVCAMFPWGEPGELEEYDGPDEWQAKVLKAIRDGLLAPNQAIRIAVASGHGVGKSALVAWIVLWSLATMVDARGVVTANTESQLRTKTWATLAGWWRMCLCKQWFILTATSIYSADPDHEKTWRVDAVPWSESNTESFAGLHNKGKRVIVVFDEASAIADEIWNVTEGALTDSGTEILWLACGNPSRSAGRFRDCFGRLKHRWFTMQVDSRTARMTNKEEIARWIEDAGSDDTDFIRVRVRGEFPRAGSMEFIAGDLVDAAMMRDAIAHPFEPLVLGVDVARFGDDASVLYWRKGRDGRTHPPQLFRGVDTVYLTNTIARLYETMRPAAIIVDDGGIGGSVVDQLRDRRLPVHAVNFGEKPTGARQENDGLAFANRAAEIWSAMREWLKGGAIPQDPEFKAQLVGREYGYVLRGGRDALQLESKESMKRRGLSSPDIADALALTFAIVIPVDLDAMGRVRAPKPVVLETEYDPFADSGLREPNVRADYDPLAPWLVPGDIHGNRP